MQPTSRKIISNQQDIHCDLIQVVNKHLDNSFLKPISEINTRAFQLANKIYTRHANNFILDSGCGVGESTFRLAKLYPDAFVLGIDQSEHRLACNNDWTLPENALLIQANLIDFWRLAALSGWKLSRHYLLYPNPWPKKKHLQRRWHGHPVFPVIFTLGGILELRTNWKIYAEEFKIASNLISDKPCQLEIFSAKNSITPFERKYQLSNQTLYQVKISL